MHAYITKMADVLNWLLLQVEHEIDKKLGITSKDDVMKMGIDKYNEE